MCIRNINVQTSKSQSQIQAEDIEVDPSTSSRIRHMLKKLKKSSEISSEAIESESTSRSGFESREQNLKSKVHENTAVAAFRIGASDSIFGHKSHNARRQK